MKTEKANTYKFEIANFKAMKSAYQQYEMLFTKPNTHDDIYEKANAAIRPKFLLFRDNKALAEAMLKALQPKPKPKAKAKQKMHPKIDTE